MGIGNLSLLAPDVFGNPIRFLAFSVIMLLMLQQSRNQERCFYTSQHWFLQWLEVLMPPYLCIGDSARLLAMVVLFNEKRLYLVYSHFFHLLYSFCDLSIITRHVCHQTVEEKIARHSKDGTVTTRCCFYFSDSKPILNSVSFKIFVLYLLGWLNICIFM